MPKLKTHRGAKKRFKVTAAKKVLHKKANKSHILTKKKSNRKRNLGQVALVDKTNRRAVKDMMPYEF
ncbi:MAG: 50S ribosomal protein L35 [Acidobacteriota bacterium]|jgi:large subunit ribosomal protein L35|nr:50S ribosomal protein L35 [Acidobacteriota bacterium]HNQ81539.1 50S ribosomal protein L35 [Candidatus Aminicenantes bacterium]MDD8028395.1 50S ribosomal protein L35 [Acidobacteriota bacterium]MDD8032538.1 50S ribosomal protein L35 [Acidobacteriota bacterium]MDD8038946.1 50S ribosomal protein L35 [Acidobacteriota bacterium]